MITASDSSPFIPPQRAANPVQRDATLGQSRRTALVIGAAGGVGSELCLALLQAGWRVRAFSRHAPQWLATVADASAVEWIAGDAMDSNAVLAAAAQVQVIAHMVNPPGYRDWDKWVLPMLDSTLQAARAVNARVLLPGTIYNFGLPLQQAEGCRVLDEGTPVAPRTAKGAIRVEMERRLQAAAERGDCRVLIVRAGDFFGARSHSSWFAQGILQAGKPVRRLWRLTDPGVGHQWAYLPDVAATMTALLEREAVLPPFACFHMQGHWDQDGMQLLNAVRAVSGQPALPVQAFPWWVLRLASPFVRRMRDLYEMRHLWQQAVRMPNDRLLAELGAEPHTPLQQAMAVTLEGLGCIEHPRREATGTV
ncbi:SDR family NAD(P)-dependent oxidoreductase [Pokkaliibacter sp. MBI-7]|uniref:NAD-dependent epimerase/dehydratase family protein n=1 Tax=Pokkaliibacter sp. MBI-7 TaxID=3040600 RepID=UPI002446AE82|nr:NAD-dependent epimerase/dehydratase family protein [Pokkaliibacter sp. MBI-7]MDH2434474.1 SDR family NAD(P)-dependent oxidoreductase [Pokkaliibacter sp. MBI-7]